jgi:hypothetical protein
MYLIGLGSLLYQLGQKILSEQWKALSFFVFLAWCECAGDNVYTIRIARLVQCIGRDVKVRGTQEVLLRRLQAPSQAYEVEKTRMFSQWHIPVSLMCFTPSYRTCLRSVYRWPE